MAKRRRSSTVEQRFCKPQVVGSIPTAGPSLPPGWKQTGLTKTIKPVPCELSRRIIADLNRANEEQERLLKERACFSIVLR